MITITMVTLALAPGGLLGGTVSPRLVMFITLWIAAFLCLLNIALAIFFRQRTRQEVISYYAAFGIELVVFVFALLFSIGLITQAQIPYHLPGGLPFNRAQIAAALAFGIGLFPAAYWHRINVSELPKRIAKDAQELKARDGGVHVRPHSPGEWMN